MFMQITNSGKHGAYHYAQLAESRRDPATGKVKTSVIYNFGLVEKLDIPGLERLIASISSILPASSAMAQGAPQGYEFLGSREIGLVWLLD